MNCCENPWIAEQFPAVLAALPSGKIRLGLGGLGSYPPQPTVAVYWVDWVTGNERSISESVAFDCHEDFVRDLAKAKIVVRDRLTKALLSILDQMFVEKTP